MLYETAARAEEILSLNAEVLDLENRRAPVTSKGGDTEWAYWDAGTARLPPPQLRLPDGHPDGPIRARGPLFLADRKPVPARHPGPEHICPHTGRPRLGYDRVRILMDKHLGLDPHQLRHSAATRLGEQKVPLRLIMAKARHKNPRTAMRYTRPGSEAVADNNTQDPLIVGFGLMWAGPLGARPRESLCRAASPFARTSTQERPGLLLLSTRFLVCAGAGPLPVCGGGLTDDQVGGAAACAGASLQDAVG